MIVDMSMAGSGRNIGNIGPRRTLQPAPQSREADRFRSAISEHVRRENELNGKLLSAMQALETANMEIARLTDALSAAEAKLAKAAAAKPKEADKKAKKKASVAPEASETAEQTEAPANS